VTTRLDPPTLGYRRKPNWIYFVGLCFILAPFGNFLVTLATLHIPQWYSPTVWRHWVRYVPVGTWALLSLVFASGLALLLFVRRWALLLTLATLLMVIAYNLVTIRQFALLGSLAIGGMAGTSAVMGYLLYFTRFRRPYTDPRIRWWETSPRYKVSIPVRIESVPAEGVLLDVSFTGALIEWPTEEAVPEREQVNTIILPPDLRLSWVSARRTARGYGLRFEVSERSARKKFKAWIRQLGKDPSQIYW
jgi:hypothetical protein